MSKVTREDAESIGWNSMSPPMGPGEGATVELGRHLLQQNSMILSVLLDIREALTPPPTPDREAT